MKGGPTGLISLSMTIFVVFSKVLTRVHLSNLHVLRLCVCPIVFDLNQSRKSKMLRVWSRVLSGSHANIRSAIFRDHMVHCSPLFNQQWSMISGWCAEMTGSDDDLTFSLFSGFRTRLLHRVLVFDDVVCLSFFRFAKETLSKIYVIPQLKVQLGAFAFGFAAYCHLNK